MAGMPINFYGNMKFEHPKDTKALIIGIAASISAVILWDIYKAKYQILNFKKQKNAE